MRRLLLVTLVLLALSAASLSPASAASAAASAASAAAKRSSATARSAPREELARRVTTYARRQLGTSYRWGGVSPGGFDCSGLVYAAFRSIGKSIPRTTWDQLRAGRRVSWRGLRPGDLLFTDHGGHVVIVVSRTVAISAPRPGRRVRVVPLSSLRASFYSARRLL
jgi:cell wall-associated NlpC family hydrolase